jgi:ACT domain-containing protein
MFDTTSDESLVIDMIIRMRELEEEKSAALTIEAVENIEDIVYSVLNVFVA